MATQNAINNLLATTSLTGVLQAAQFPALTGDVTTTATSLVTTLATVNGNVGTFAVQTVNAKGLITAAANLTGDITSSSGATTLATVNSNVGSFTSANITVNAKGLVTAAANGTAAFAPMPTTVVSGSTQQAAVNNCYVSNNAGTCTITLPTTASVGDEIQIMGLGAGGWALAQNASQLVHFGNIVTTTGTGGSVASQNAFDSLRVKCVVANTTFNVIAAQGNMTTA